MYKLISDLPQHIEQASQLFNRVQLPEYNHIQNIVITGLGGSGIGGSIAADICSSTCPVPITINKTYHLPGFVNQKTLVIACSYSGNTEETLMALGRALEKNAQIISITSGGKLLELAEKNNFPAFVVPGGNPPRSMLGYSLTLLLLLLQKLNFTSLKADEQLAEAARLVNIEQERIKLHAKELALKTKNLIPVTYACSGFGGVATRWRQQFNENAKLPGWDAEIPEMNHNELVGWAGGNDSLVAYILRSTDDFRRNQKRIEISAEIIKANTPNVYEIWTQGNSHIAQAFYLIHLGDWISYYLSEEHQVDIFDIKVIDHLKSELSKF